ncbi:hypothetical protein HDG33_001731 [Paraburkholderia sp. Cpub6]|nr:hypothetical protein [Paraburkholderia sp. Cpub6]
MTNTGFSWAATVSSRISFPQSLSSGIWSYSSVRSGASLFTGISNSSRSNNPALADPSRFSVWIFSLPTVRTRSEAPHQ